MSEITIKDFDKLELEEKLERVLGLETILNNSEQEHLLEKAKEIVERNPENFVDYEQQQKSLNDIQKRVNVFDKMNIQPVKKSLKFVADKMIGNYQKEHIDYLKGAKKTKERQAIDTGIIIIDEAPKVQTPTKEQGKAEIATSMIMERLKTLNTETNLEEIKFLNQLLSILK